MILLLLLLALFIAARKSRPRVTVKQTPKTTVNAKQIERDAKQRQRETVAAEKAAARERKETAARQQAAADAAFLVGQIDKLYSMLWDADADLDAARRTCEHDREANKAGAVVAEKIASKHRAERDKLEKKVMQLERNIHSYESKLNKAQQIAQN